MHRLERNDSDISPSTIVPPRSSDTNGRGNIAPWEAESPSEQVNNNVSIPTINRQPPSASPWSPGDRSSQMPNSVFGNTFYNYSSENVDQGSPTFRPSSSPGQNDDDYRRPSIASATTVSSTGSTSIGGKIHKKLHGFFGEEYKGLQDESRQHSETSLTQGGQPAFSPGVGAQRIRTNSTNAGATGSNSPSPSDSRPRSPAAGPNSEVTPWEFQDSKVRYSHTFCRSYFTY